MRVMCGKEKSILLAVCVKFAKQLAKQMCVSYKVLNDILNGRRVLATAVSMMFEAALSMYLPTL